MWPLLLLTCEFLSLPDKVIFLISHSVGILTVLTQAILIRYEFSSVTMFVLKQKMTFLMKLDQN